MDKRKLMGLFIIAVMVLSTVALVVIDLASQSSVSVLEYNDFTFRQLNDRLLVDINGEEQVFFFFPGDIEYVELPDLSVLSAPVLTVTYGPSNDSETFAVLQFLLEEHLSGIKTVERALTDSSNTSLPQKSCVDASSDNPVVLLEFSNSSGISVVDNCVVLSGLDAYDLLGLSERLSYRLLGVMNG